MTLSLSALVAVLLVPALLGAALLRLQGIGPRTDPLAFGGWSWLQGCVGIALALSAWLWLGLPLRAAWLTPVLLALAALIFVLARSVPLLPASAGPRPPTRPFPTWERWLFALVLVFLVLTTVDRILLAADAVLATSDEARIWAAKAKVLYHAGGFGAEFRAALRTPGMLGHPDYPPLNPLLQLWVHMHAGEIVHVESRLPIQLFCLVNVLVAASALRRRARPLVAALFLACIGTLGRFYAYQVFSDMLIAAGLLVCWDLWQRFQEDGEPAWLRLLGTSALLLVWSKNEGLLHLLVFGLALLAAARLRRVRLPRRGERWECLVWTAPLWGSVLYLQWFNWHFGLVNDLVQGQARGLSSQDGAGFVQLTLERAAHNLGPVVRSFASLIAEAERTGGLLLAFLVLSLVSPRSAAGEGRLVFQLGLLFALLGYMAVYLGTHWEVETHLEHSAHRLVFHLLPSAGLWVLLYVVDALPRLGTHARGDAKLSRLPAPARTLRRSA